MAPEEQIEENLPRDMGERTHQRLVVQDTGLWGVVGCPQAVHGEDRCAGD